MKNSIQRSRKLTDIKKAAAELIKILPLSVNKLFDIPDFYEV